MGYYSYGHYQWLLDLNLEDSENELHKDRSKAELGC